MLKEIKEKLGMTTIRESFKQFCRNRHVEDKGKNHDLLQGVYAETEFFDLSILLEGEEDKGKHIGAVKDKENLVKFTRNENTILATLKSISLPFKNCFIRLNDKMHLFIREYSPEIITGALSMECDMYLYENNRKVETVIWNFPFSMNINGESAKITCSCPPEWFDTCKPKEEDVESVELSEGLPFDVVKKVGEVFETLSKRAVLSDVPTITKYSYFRRKKSNTMKVAQKPIYYVLGEKSDKVKIKYACETIKSEGKLEYSYAFRVRGHWRRIGDKSFGKDRSGVYGVKGFTWVVDHIRGEGELSKRLRVIKYPCTEEHAPV